MSLTSLSGDMRLAQGQTRWPEREEANTQQWIIYNESNRQILKGLGLAMPTMRFKTTNREKNWQIIVIKHEIVHI